MLRLNFLLAIRSLLKNRTTSFINVTGLAVSFTALLLIVLYIQQELNYDQYHANANRIFRISRESLDSKGNTEIHFGHTQPSLAIYLKKDFEEVEDAVRLSNNGNSLVSSKELTNVEARMFFADESIFSVFSWKVVKGNKQAPMQEINSITLSQSTASRYFGQEDPIGKILVLEGQHSMMVTAVYEDFPANSHFKADFLCSMRSLERINGLDNMMSDQSNNYATYVLLRPNVSVKQFEAKIGVALDNYYSPDPDGRKPSQVYRYHTWALKDLHLYYTMDSETEPNGNYLLVYVFAALATLILAMACFNFINLSTARLSQRAKEVGLKKVIGAQRFTLFMQFVLEAVLSGLVSMVMAFTTAYFLIPDFNSFMGKSFCFSMLTEPSFLLASWILLLMVGLVAGGYPALRLSSFKPSEILRKGVSTSWKRFSLRAALVSIHFFISILLIVSVVVIRSQLDFVASFDPGFDKNNIIVLPSSDVIYKKFRLIKEQLEQQKGIAKVSMGSRVPSGRLDDAQRLKIEKSGQFIPVDLRLADVHVDHDYIKTLGLQIASGRDFDYQIASDSSEAFIINETAVNALGWKSNEDAIGKSIHYGSRHGNIVGVVKDINFESLHEPIKPFVLVVTRGRTRSVIVRIDPLEREAILNYLREQWAYLRPGFPFSYFLLSDNFEKSYQQEIKLAQGINFFALFAIVVSSLGVFGLALFMTEQRSREMGIRKILGANSSSIAVLFAKWFFRLIFWAALVAIPLGYWGAQRWLKNFAFAVPVGVSPFVIALLTIAFCTLVSIGTQIIRTTFSNPVGALRDH